MSPRRCVSCPPRGSDDAGPRRQPSKCARQNVSNSDRVAAFILGTFVLLIHRPSRREKIALERPRTSVSPMDAYENSLFFATNRERLAEAGSLETPCTAIAIYDK
jgi:hypothetical protein